ncbi:ribosomal protein L4/L1 family protein [Colletotrichum costaricense]|uniref:Large ribosomal subunit protein uL4m n=2 Tax=Colletotrichum acutatum species complex TaxID=2707335 RepID=A0AAI9Z9N7_9PEZI|nr:ribosomal protein L4/L1 family protein [Colletotrichum costaricense]XP_060384208.1 ribosomal protein L4/L1 family protein [Colletotrichum tamarilloi]KAK1502559.1 ribosomal protein L4/L1 family protein [Colletotrichum tamarilloi]KAK1539451.1 ribosomal protein L4/L1 family protein [Colletotrichum costaricense]
MAGKGVRSLGEAMRGLSLSSTCRNASPATSFIGSSSFTRSMATEAPFPGITTSVYSTSKQAEWTPTTSVPVTVHAFPTLEPQSLESYSTKHLYLPLRRDLLHLAVVYEGDSTRQGTASTKTRWEVRGSHRKLHPQKGTGRARAGTKQSPIRRGGGVSHGPKPRDFSTSLNRKVYDVAWRTALSYRYRRGQLIVCEDGMELPLPQDFLALTDGGFVGPKIAEEYRRKWMMQVLEANQWGKAHGRTLFITNGDRPRLEETMETVGDQGRCLGVHDVDVKDLLEEGRVVVERAALNEMIESHQSDLISKIFIGGTLKRGPAIGGSIIS